LLPLPEHPTEPVIVTAFPELPPVAVAVKEVPYVWRTGSEPGAIVCVA